MKKEKNENGKIKIYNESEILLETYDENESELFSRIKEQKERRISRSGE